MEKKMHKLFILVLLSVFLGATSLLLVMGEPPRSIVIIILSGLAFAPLEIYGTVFFLESFLKQREVRETEFREDAEYFSIASEEQKQLIWLIKNNLGKAFNEHSPKQTEENFTDVCTNKNHVIAQRLAKGVSQDPDLFAEFEKVGTAIKSEILDFYSVFLKFIPLDLFKELHGIYQIVEVSLLFSDNPYLFQEKDEVVSKYRDNQFNNQDYQRLTDLSVKQLVEISRHIENMERMTAEHQSFMVKEP